MKRAFTLIELLVVIAIIAILAAILFPVFAQAKQAAKKAVDLSNMKQIGVAMQIYLSDYDDTYPMSYYYRNDNGSAGTVPNCGYVHWTGLIQPYVKNIDIFRSPSDKLGVWRRRTSWVTTAATARLRARCRRARARWTTTRCRACRTWGTR